MRHTHKPAESYVICIHNAENPASLELRKVYRVLPDAGAKAHGMVRVVDESGEDYLYPAKWFVGISLPLPARKALAATG